MYKVFDSDFQIEKQEALKTEAGMRWPMLGAAVNIVTTDGPPGCAGFGATADVLCN